MRGLLMLAALPALIAACTAPSTTPKCEALIDYALVVDNSASLDADAKSKIRYVSHIEPWLSRLSGLSAPVWALSGRCLGTVWLDT